MRMTGKNHIIKTARIKDVAELDPETLGESTAPGFTFKYIDLSSVKGGRVGEHVESMTFAGAPGRARKLVKEGDILLGMVRPYLKPFAKVQRVFDGHVASTGFAVIRAKLDVTDPEYLYQTIWSDGVSKQIHQMVTGSNYPALSVGDVKDLKIPLPPLADMVGFTEKTDEAVGSIYRDACCSHLRLADGRPLLRTTDFPESYSAPSIYPFNLYCWSQTLDH